MYSMNHELHAGEVCLTINEQLWGGGGSGHDKLLKLAHQKGTPLMSILCAAGVCPLHRHSMAFHPGEGVNFPRILRPQVDRVALPQYPELVEKSLGIKDQSCPLLRWSRNAMWQWT